MKKLFYLFIIVLFSCSPKKKEEEINNLKDLIVYLDQDNSRAVMYLKKEVMEEGNKPSDMGILDKAKLLVSKKNSLKGKTSFLSDYYTYLQSEYGIVEEKDSSRLRRAEHLIFNFETEKDSTIFYHAFANLILIENDIIHSLSMQVGTSCRSFYNQYARVYKEKDTIKSGETYSLVLMPDFTCPSNMDVTIDPNIKVFYNGTRVDVPVAIEKAGGLYILKLSPKNSGNYKIAGDLTLNNLPVNFSFSNKYSDAFYVK
ncbi:MAG: hypothetical protein K0R51_3470 [Cytophagaceae bacterium]|jgi:hypothetical protein|nr:hypothetical protein [Cytophagaceae bacterium]